MERYQFGQEGFADTEELDEWTDLLLRFEDAWSNPECSPTRSTFHTGKYAHQTGVGRVVNCDESEGLELDDPNLLPKLLQAQGYATGAFGKWHMGTRASSSNPECEGVDAPILAGYDRFEGVLLDQQTGQSPELIYEEFVLTEISDPATDCVGGPPNTTITGGYQTREISSRAAAWIAAQQEPWFAYVPFTAAHEPIHCPPASFYPGVTFVCQSGQATDLQKYRDMIKALGIDIDRLLSAVAEIGDDDAPVLPDDTVIFVVGDNGSFPKVTEDPFDGQRSKATVFQGGVRVPFWAGGVDAASGSVPLGVIAGAIDLYATLLELSGFDTSTLADIHSVDLSPLFTAPTVPVRTFLYTEHFFPNFDPTPPMGELQGGPSSGQQAVRNDSYKLIETTGNARAYFDLGQDPFEGDNLLLRDPSTWTQEQRDNLPILEGELDAILPGGLLSICEKTPLGDPCAVHEDCCSGFCSATGPTGFCFEPTPLSDCP